MIKPKYSTMHNTQRDCTVSIFAERVDNIPTTQLRYHGHCDTGIRCVMLEMTECDKFGVCRSHEQNCTLLQSDQVPLSLQLMTIFLST